MGGFYKYDFFKVFGLPEKPSRICGKCREFTLLQFCCLRLIKNLRILLYYLSEAVKTSKSVRQLICLFFMLEMHHCECLNSLNLMHVIIDCHFTAN